MNSVETQHTSTNHRQWFSSFLIAVGFVLLGLFLGQIIAFLVSIVLFNLDFASITQILTNPSQNPDSRGILLLIQAGSTLFGFVLAPLLHFKLIDKEPNSQWFTPESFSPQLIVVVLLLTFTFITANSVIIEWNMNLDFSKLSTSFEEWARAKEESLSELTEFITQFDSIGGLVAGLVVIAVLPAVGEEMVFRGIVQRKVLEVVKNPHAAIWVAALVFSAIHLQFYGFFPRLLLGALFGYIYYWSGNLIYPMAAHFLNNGFTLVMLYLYQQKATDIDIESTDSVPWTMALLALVAGIGLMIYFRKSVLALRHEQHG